MNPISTKDAVLIWRNMASDEKRMTAKRILAAIELFKWLGETAIACKN